MHSKVNLKLCTITKQNNPGKIVKLFQKSVKKRLELEKKSENFV